jgi:hypothetical protein
MVDAREKIKPFGIELEWNECWSREECLKRIERDEKFEEERLEHGQDEISFLVQDVNEWSDLEESLI